MWLRLKKEFRVRSSGFGFALAVGCVLLVSGCSFTPVYQKGGLASELSAIKIDTVRTREGQLLKAALEDNLHTDYTNQYALRYRLAPTVTIGTQALSIESDGTTRRYRLIGRSEIHLYDISSGKKIYYDTVERLSSYNISDADYSTYIAGRDAQKQVVTALAEDIRLRLIAYFNKQGQ